MPEERAKAERKIAELEATLRHNDRPRDAVASEFWPQGPTDSGCVYDRRGVGERPETGEDGSALDPVVARPVA
jgi:hypothetical protein